jgi:hypothetical protein
MEAQQMDKEEAVKLLRCMLGCVPLANEFVEAVDMAIEEMEK